MKLHYLNGVVDMKVHNYVIIASLKSEPINKLINRIPGKALRTLVESRGMPRNSTCILQAEPGKLDIKRHSPSNRLVFSIFAASSNSCTHVEEFQCHTGECIPKEWVRDGGPEADCTDESDEIGEEQQAHQ